MSFEPTRESVRTHRVPRWFDDAKLGIFLHWGLYSVPAWAPQVPDIHTILRDHDPAWLFRNSPYAEWYLNTMQLEGSPTTRHHADTYGAATPYDAFRAPFDDASAHADLNALADLCRRAGAGYVVLTTKHHDGFCLWPASEPHPAKGAYHARRDLVGELTDAVRTAGLRMGLYYSGGFDWPFNDAVVRGVADMVLAVPRSPEYAAYCDAHLRELIQRYRPSVLWNDIACPPGVDLARLFADYYNAVPDGVVNDRWTQTELPDRPAANTAVRAVGATIQGLWRFVPESWKDLDLQRPGHADFRTPEYTSRSEIAEDKWESTRGIGHSFGANRSERPEDILSTTQLVRSFVDIVSKNGNLLIGIGPEPDGTIPSWQATPLLGLGEWLDVNGEAVFGSRPWERAEGTTSQGTPVRFTRRDGAIYAVLLEAPPTRRVELRDVDASGVEEVRFLGIDDGVTWEVVDGTLRVTLPDRLPVAPALTLRLSPGDGIRPRWD